MTGRYAGFLLPVVVWVVVMLAFSLMVYTVDYPTGGYFSYTPWSAGIPSAYLGRIYICSWGGNASISIRLSGIKMAKFLVLAEAIGSGSNVTVSRLVVGDSRSLAFTYELRSPDLYRFTILVAFCAK
ncbi:hypothetical protein Pyrfu_1016 [Pyrolobus fumarii 1A]|uniref:Uncharacterized protein n=1 Tax=Pyrolobus fumarii (strain DSM 11204 / 1A) TaxID=694429 RepID=G0EER2_PYRF1|nr:hypothetical protein [Pyrolobus fumarii]AEM38884.1 hypothetical protein Pyrfu_1016 [Pyrolobus fumarii 1A]